MLHGVSGMSDQRNTLQLPFEQGIVAAPQDSENWLFLNADALPRSDIDWASQLTCEQGFRPTFNALEQAGFSASPTVDIQQRFAGTLLLTSRVKQVNQLNLARAWNATCEGGIIAVAGVKTTGIQPLRKWAAQQTEVVGSLSKHHAVVFWMVRTGADWPLPDLHSQVDGFEIAPGMFSASGPDKGSQLLVEHFTNRIRGKVADFGAGWGYLSAELVKRSDAVESLELFEADYASLKAAEKNATKAQRFNWVDMSSEAPRGPFDWIIMNPPFHKGRAAEPELGQVFIQAAAKSLPSGGRLLMVANTNLPYENVLTACFKKVERLEQAMGFKIIQAVR